MKKKFSKNAYFNQLKNGRLKLSIKLFLRLRGMRDAKKAILREDENGNFVSPFIYQEIQLYNLAFQIEQEQLIQSLLSIQSEMDILQSKIEQKELLMNLPSTPPNISSDYSELKQASTILKTKKQELLSFKNMESDIAQLHNKQLYSILQAKISIYWEGVLQVSNGDAKFPPIIFVNKLVQGGELFYDEQE